MSSPGREGSPGGAVAAEATGPLAGVHIGITASRRADQLRDALRRRGAQVSVGAMLRADRRTDDATLLAQTDAALTAAPGWFAASTGKGMQLWAEVLERRGRLEAVVAALRGMRTVARGPKAVGGLKAVGLEPEFVAASETDDEVAGWLLQRVGDGEVVLVQRHGVGTGAFRRLAATARVVMVTPYRTDPPDDTGPARRLVDAVCAGEIDVLAFTSRPAAENLFVVAEAMGGETAARLEEALAGEKVAIAAVGPVTAQAFRRRGLPVAIQPDRYRTGALVAAIGRWAAGAAPAP